MSDHDDAVAVITLARSSSPAASSCTRDIADRSRSVSGMTLPPKSTAQSVRMRLTFSSTLWCKTQPPMARRSRATTGAACPYCGNYQSDFDEISDNQPEQLARHSLV